MKRSRHSAWQAAIRVRHWQIINLYGTSSGTFPIRGKPGKAFHPADQPESRGRASIGFHKQTWR
jgi:hypothetical protein